MIKTFELSTRAACRNLDLSRSVYNYQPQPHKDDDVIEALQDLAERRPAYGFGLMFATLRRNRKRWSHKRVYRVYKALNLHMRRKGKSAYLVVLSHPWSGLNNPITVGPLIL